MVGKEAQRWCVGGKGDCKKKEFRRGIKTKVPYWNPDAWNQTPESIPNTGSQKYSKGIKTLKCWRDSDQLEVAGNVGAGNGNPDITPRIRLIGLIEGEQSNGS